MKTPHFIQRFFTQLSFGQPKPLNWYVSAPLPIFAGLTLVVILTIAPKMMDDLVKENAVETAIDLTQTLQKIRNYYAQHVLADIAQADDSGITITHLHKLTDNSIPIPATFLIEMAQTYTEEDKLRVNVTSPYPFESRKNRVMAPFQQQAWQQLTVNPDVPVSEFAVINDRRVVKVALPDRLTSQSCVDCHNSHQGSGKQDWQLGDVRGIVEITVDVEMGLKRANALSTIMITASFVSLFLLVLFNLGLARKIVKPLSAITQAMSALSERRIIETQSKKNDYLEVTALSDAFVQFQNHERKRQALETEVHKLAYFDPLTEMPNRASLLRFLTNKNRDLSNREQLILILVSVEKFNEVNDILGYHIGDRALLALSKRLNSACHHTFIARYSANEFAVSTVSEMPQQTELLTDQILKVIAEPIYIDEHEVSVNLALGTTSVSANNGLASADIIAQANIALHQAQVVHTQQSVAYQPALAEQLNERVTMIKALKQAIVNDELVPYFQPQIDLRTKQLIGAEVLLRWQKPNGELVPPFKFIPIAEMSRLIIPIGQLVLEQACHYNKQWQQQGFKPFRIAVNVSGVQFNEDDIIARVKQALSSSQLAPQWLELEVTETALMADINEIVDKLTQLRSLGVELAIDDFGTGYSSLSYLKQLPIHRLKIDQSFVRNTLSNKDDQAIIQTILNLGKTMNLKVLAEGVEGQQEETYLAQLGCDEAQGYFYAKPMPAEAFTEYLKQHNQDEKKP